MQLKTLQIVWHGKEPVLSVDFQPNSHTLVSGGQDGEVKHWEVVSEEDGSPGVRFLSSYPVNSKSVNCVRFSPMGDMLASAGDKGEVLLWRFTAFALGSQQQRQAGLEASSGEGAPGAGGAVSAAPTGMWRQVGLLRGHCDDVLDLAWAPDGSALLSGGIENNCILWDVEGRKSLKWLQDHGHYVQGVAWDPLGRYIASQSADRTARVYAVKPPNPAEGGKRSAAAAAAAAALLTASALARDGFYAAATLSKGPLSVPPVPPVQQAAVAQQQQQGPLPGQADGAAAPPGQPASASAAAGVVGGGAAAKQPLFCDDSLPTFFRRLAWSPDGSFLAAPAGVYRAAQSAPVTSTTHIFSRGEWSGPAVSLPCLSKGALVVRFCPRLFRAPQPPAQQQQQAAGAAATTWLPYRVLMAVASVDSVLVYDMQALEPLAVLGGIHFAAVTDMAWSDDGRFLVVASRDGYCTVCSFDEAELGKPVPLEELPPGVAAVVSRAAARRYHEDRSAAAAAAAAAKSTAAAAAAAAAATVAAAATQGGDATGAAALTAEEGQVAPGASTATAAAAAGCTGPQQTAAPGSATAGPRRIQPVAVGPSGGASSGLKRPAEGAPASGAPKPKRIQPIPLSAIALSAPVPAAAGGSGTRGAAAQPAAVPTAAASAGAGASPARRRIAPTRVDAHTATAGGGLSPHVRQPSIPETVSNAVPITTTAAALAQTPKSGGSGGAGEGPAMVVPGMADGAAAPGSAVKMPTPQVLVFGTPPGSSVAGRDACGGGGYPQAQLHPHSQATKPHQGHHVQPQQDPAPQAAKGPKRLTPIPVERGQRLSLGAAGPVPSPAALPAAAGSAGQAAQASGPEGTADDVAQPRAVETQGTVSAEQEQRPTQQQRQGAGNGAGGSGGGAGPRLSIAQLAAMRGAAAARQAAGGR